MLNMRHGTDQTIYMNICSKFELKLNFCLKSLSISFGRYQYRSSIHIIVQFVSLLRRFYFCFFRLFLFVCIIFVCVCKIGSFETLKKYNRLLNIRESHPKKKHVHKNVIHFLLLFYLNLFIFHFVFFSGLFYRKIYTS